MEKTARKNIKYSRDKTILKIGHFARAMAQAKYSVWVKTYNSKNHAEIDSTALFKYFCKENRSKNTKYLRNETILKIGHVAKAIIAHAKLSVWVKN